MIIRHHFLFTNKNSYGKAYCDEKCTNDYAHYNTYNQIS